MSMREPWMDATMMNDTQFKQMVKDLLNKNNLKLIRWITDPACNKKVDYSRCPDCNCLLDRHLKKADRLKGYDAWCFVCEKWIPIKEGK
jgi:hypothetical protein